ncbi:MAG: hypothetical protein ACRC1K_09020 [Planctomycetia bacterium]
MRYAASDFQPEDFLRFIELDGFQDDWKHLRLTDDDLRALQMCIMTGPKYAKVVPGTGGLRKGRFAPSRWGTGKSGGARICYVYFEEWSVVLLVGAYGKSEKDDISPAQKAMYAKIIKCIENELSDGTIG